MKLTRRRTLVELFEKSNQLDELKNPIFSKIGEFYAQVTFPEPKDAIGTGTLATIQYAKLVFLASDANRLHIKASHKLRLNGSLFEINALPCPVLNNRLYVNLTATRKAQNGE